MYFRLPTNPIPHTTTGEVSMGMIDRYVVEERINNHIDFVSSFSKISGISPSLLPLFALQPPLFLSLLLTFIMPAPKVMSTSSSVKPKRINGMCSPFTAFSDYFNFSVCSCRSPCQFSKLWKWYFHIFSSIFPFYSIALKIELN